MTPPVDRRRFLETALKLPFIASVSYGGLGLRLTVAQEIDETVFDAHQAATLAQLCGGRPAFL